MKNYLYTAVLLLCLTACKKETPTTNNNSNNAFAANDSLVNPAAHMYFIADVEGIPGTTHFDQQDTIASIVQLWTSGHCTNGDCRYGGGISNDSYNPNMQFIIQYSGVGETKDQLLVPAYTSFLPPSGESHGITVTYNAPNGKSYYSNLTDNRSLSWANITLVSRENTGDTSTFMPTPYSLTFHFNCELTCSTNSTEKIRLKNAVARVRM